MALAARAFALSGEGPADRDRDKGVERFLINDQWVEGTIIDKDDDGFKLRMNVGGVETDVELPWSALSSEDRKRLRGGEGDSKLAELMAQGADIVPATRFRFKNGCARVGIVVEEKSTPETIVIHTKYAREFHFLRKEVESTEQVMFPETELYTLDEIYQRKKAQLNPQEDARRHFKLAQHMMKIRHWAKAKDHFERARLLDERFGRPAGQKIEEIDAARLDAEVRRLDDLINSDVRAGRWVKASRRIRTLSALDPDNYIRTMWEAQLPQIEENLRKALRRSVVRSYYRKMGELIRNWVWGRISDGGAIPGVVVMMRGGEAVQGKLVSDDEEFIVVRNENRTIRVAKDMVADVSNVNINKRRRVPGYADSRRYVEDTTGGITAAIIAGLVEEYKDSGTQQFPINQELIESFWNDRLTSVVTITRQGRELKVPVCSTREAAYGTGTWLREGTPAAAATFASAGRRLHRRTQTDPERWWMSQPHEVRYQIVRAMAAEALCEVQKVIKVGCPPCGGRGSTVALGSGDSVGKISTTSRVCATCRGSGYFIKIRYR